jgi:hypothetical protein
LVFTLQVFEEAAALAYQFEEPAAAVVVFFVFFEVLGEVVDAIGKEGNLHFRGSRIAGTASEFLDRFLFHSFPVFLLIYSLLAYHAAKEIASTHPA